MPKSAEGRTRTLQTRINTDFFKIVQAPVIDLSIGFCCVMKITMCHLDTGVGAFFVHESIMNCEVSWFFRF